MTVLKGQITGFNDREDGVFDFYVKTDEGDTYTLSSLGYAKKDIELNGTEYIARRLASKEPRMLFKDETIYFTPGLFKVAGRRHKIPGWVTSGEWKTRVVYVSGERYRPIGTIIFSKGVEK